jgi:hypothetical protein
MDVDRLLSWNGTRTLAITVLAAMLAVAAAGASLLYTERAVVKLSLPSRPVAVNDAVLNGAAQGALTTQRLTATVTDQQTGTSSSATFPATTAAGWVQFWCSPMTSCPSGYTVAAGTVLESLSGARYVTESNASFPSCAPSSAIAVYSITPGAAGNASPRSLVYGSFPGYIHVTNPGAIGGGADARTVPVVLQSDLDTVAATLKSQVASQLATQLKTQAAALDYFADAAPAFTVTSDHRAGDNAATFTVTVAGTLSATAFSASAAQAVLRQDLARQVPAGYRLMPGPLGATYAAQGESVTGSASGYMTPVVDGASIASNLRGLDLSQARGWLHQAVPGAVFQIQTSPAAMPRLPLLSDHISIVFTAQV